jgi:hypothetical protein
VAGCLAGLGVGGWLTGLGVARWVAGLGGVDALEVACWVFGGRAYGR